MAIFEAFVFCGDYEDEATPFLEEREMFGFDSRHLEAEDNMSVLFIDTPETLEPEVVDRVAKEIAQEFGNCLYVYYNDEENTSYAMLYDASDFLEMFGEDDEIWVELDENGNPNPKGQRYTRAEVTENQDPEKSFNCIFSSLDSALLRLNSVTTIRGQALVVLDEVEDDDEDEDEDEDEQGFF